MNIVESVFLGVVEGITEFLPVSSTGHLTIVESLLGENIAADDITAFTAIIQSGAVVASLIYFRKDLWRLIMGFVRGLISAEGRQSPDWRLCWAVILGSIPIGIVGVAFHNQIEHTLRSLWVVAFALIGWSFAMGFADHAATQVRHEDDTTWKDTLIIGIVQCLALIPGVSRSGSTMSAGLLRDFDRVTVTKLSFFLAIPALFGATAQQINEYGSEISAGVGWTNTGVATLVSFVVGYASIAWLLKFVAGHTYKGFIAYRIVAGALLIVLLATKTIKAQ